ncbi:hypothetical protein ACFL4G_03665 [Thermodesulfobacteriota bacterium]
MKSPILAAFLSMVLPGLGHFYIGQGGRGVFFIVLFFCIQCVTVVLAMSIGLRFGIDLVSFIPESLLRYMSLLMALPTMLLVSPVILWAAVDAYRKAARGE